MLTRATVDGVRVTVWQERAPSGDLVWRWQPSNAEPAWAGFRTMSAAIEDAQRVHGQSVRVCRHSEETGG